MSEQQFAFTAAELTLISCECDHCGTGIVVDVIAAKYSPPDKRPTCHTTLAAFCDAVLHYRRFYNEAEKMKKIQLRTKPVVAKG